MPEGARERCRELHEARETLVPPDFEQERKRDLRIRWIGVESFVVRVGEVADLVLLTPERGSGEVIRERVPVVRMRADDQSHDVAHRDSGSQSEDEQFRGISERAGLLNRDARRSGSPDHEPHEDRRGEHSSEPDQDRLSRNSFERREDEGQPYDLGEGDDVGCEDELGQFSNARGRGDHESRSDEQSRRQDCEQYVAHGGKSRSAGG
jgi:hypothetical protein